MAEIPDKIDKRPQEDGRNDFIGPEAIIRQYIDETGAVHQQDPETGEWVEIIPISNED